jgi:glycosyltransferase involved in cell wall biosynthesis
VRILLPVHGFPPTATAGVEVYTLRLARALQARGHEALVLSGAHDLSAAPGVLRTRSHEGVRVAEVPNVYQGSLERTYDMAEGDAAAAQVMESFAPDVVHVQHLMNLGIGVLRQARAAGAGVVMTLHDHWLSCPRDGLRMRSDLALCETLDHAVCATCMAASVHLVPPLQHAVGDAARALGAGRVLHRLNAAAPRLTRAAVAVLRRVTPPDPSPLTAAMDRRKAALAEALAAVDLFVAPTRFVAERAAALGLAAERVRHVPLGVLDAPLPRRRVERVRRFGFIGTVAPHKGVHVLVDAFRRLAVPDATLDVHGSLVSDSAYVERLRAAAAGDRRIRFCGPFPEGGQQRVLSGLDALVLPSVWWETTGMVLWEAIAAGLPVIASATGGMPEVVRDGHTGLLVPPGDAEALSGALRRLADGPPLDGDGPPPRTADEGAVELLQLYGTLRS